MSATEKTVVYGLDGKREIHSFPYLGYVLTLPYATDLNRCVDRERVNEIYESFKRNSNVQGIVSVTFATIGTDMWLVDGQHRLEALRMFVSGHQDREHLLERVQIHVREIEVRDRNQATSLHVEIGRSVPAKIVENERENLYLRTLDEFLLGCVNRPKTSTSPQYGNWPQCFSEVVKNSGFFEKFKTPEQMIKEIQELNTCIFKLVVQTSNQKIRNYITDGRPQRFNTNACKLFCETYKLTPSSNMVMCLFLIVRYGFMDIILDKIFSYPELSYDKYLSKERRLNFNDVPSMAAEGDANERFFGRPEPGKVCRRPCPVCTLSWLDREDRSSYHFGHIVARAKGGSNTASNLIPVCPKCNLDCRSENLGEYCQRKFSRSLEMST